MSILSFFYSYRYLRRLFRFPFDSVNPFFFLLIGPRCYDFETEDRFRL